jgi:hypothetical protein
MSIEIYWVYMHNKGFQVGLVTACSVPLRFTHLASYY